MNPNPSPTFHYTPRFIAQVNFRSNNGRAEYTTRRHTPEASGKSVTQEECDSSPNENPP